MNREALRQQMLVRALWRDEAVPEGWLHTPARATPAQALAAYRGNAGATAERALGGAFPTVAALVGREAFAALAWHFWHEHPPERGDLGEWGADLPDFIASREQLADVPYLPDSARLDWAVHRATRAADLPTQQPAPQTTPQATPQPTPQPTPVAVTPPTPSPSRPPTTSPAEARTWPTSLLHALAHTDPACLRLSLAAGAAVVCSAHPIATLWLAHQGTLPLDAARAALLAQQPELAFVWRDAQYRVHVQALAAADAAFTAALLRRQPLSAALDEAGPDFAFDQWLVQALGRQWLAGHDTPLRL